MPSDKRRIILPISRENPRYHQNHPLLPPLLHFFLPPPTSSLQPHLHSSSLLPLSLSLPRSKSTDLVSNKSRTANFRTSTANFSSRPVQKPKNRRRRREEGGEKGPERRVGFFFPRVGGVGRAGRSRNDQRVDDGVARWSAIIIAAGEVCSSAFWSSGWPTRSDADPSWDERESREKSRHWAGASGRPTTRCASTDAATHCADVATTTTSSPRRPSAAPLAPLLLSVGRGTRATELLEGGEGGIDQSNTREQERRDIEMSRGRKKN